MRHRARGGDRLFPHRLSRDPAAPTGHIRERPAGYAGGFLGAPMSA